MSVTLNICFDPTKTAAKYYMKPAACWSAELIFKHPFILHTFNICHAASPFKTFIFPLCVVLLELAGWTEMFLTSIVTIKLLCRTIKFKIIITD